MALLGSSINAPTQLQVENSLIYESQSYGMLIPEFDSQLLSFKGDVASYNERAVFVNYTAVRSINDGSVFVKMF